MDDIKQLIKSKLSAAPNKRLHSEIHALADEISTFFGERKKFAMYLGVIKRVGATRALTIFSEVKGGNANDPRKLFFWKCRTAPKATEADAKPAAENPSA